MPRPRKILIITNGALCRNPRVLKEATTLGLAGHDVRVLNVRNHAPSVAIDAGLQRDAPFRVESLDGLARSARLRGRLAREAVRRLGWQSPEALGPCSALLRRARAANADLTIVHNEVAHVIGTQLVADGRRVAADLEDWHSEDLLPADRAHRPLRLIRETEAFLLRHAVHTTTTSHALAAALHQRHGGRRPHVITNSFPLQPCPVAHGPGETPAFFWFSQTIGPGRGLESFLAAWSRTVLPSRVVLLGDVRPEYRAALQQLLPADRRAALAFLPPVTPAELPALIARHHVGLALEDAVIRNRDLTITNKILQYLNAGLALVASDTAGQREVLAHAPDAGVIVDAAQTDAFAAQLDALLRDQDALVLRQRAARSLAKAVYCWERETPRLLALVDAALRSEPPTGGATPRPAQSLPS